MDPLSTCKTDLTLDAGRDGNAFTFNDSADLHGKFFGHVNIYSGLGNDKVFLRGEACPVSIEGQNGNDTVYIGHQARGLHNFQTGVSISNSSGGTSLIIIDTDDPSDSVERQCDFDGVADNLGLDRGALGGGDFDYTASIRDGDLEVGNGLIGPVQEHDGDALVGV